MIELKLGPDKILPIFDYRKPIILVVGWHKFSFSAMKFSPDIIQSTFYLLSKYVTNKYTFTEIEPRTMKPLNYSMFEAKDPQQVAQECLDAYLHPAISTRYKYILYQFESNTEFTNWFNGLDKSHMGILRGMHATT